MNKRLRQVVRQIELFLRDGNRYRLTVALAILDSILQSEEK